MMDAKKSFETIDEYMDTLSDEDQTILQELRRVIQETVPDAKEAISYQMPTFKLNGKNLVHFAAFKNHIGFYPTPTPIETFLEPLSRYKMAKGSVQFPKSEPLPFDLIREMVQHRAQEITAKEQAKKKKA